MFLVRRAREVMDTDVLVLPARDQLRRFLRRARSTRAGMRHVVVTDKGRIFGVLRVNTGAAARPRGRPAPASRWATSPAGISPSCARTMVAFDVIDRMWRKEAMMAVVVRGRGVPRRDDVVGVITKEHVADSVASSLKIYPR